MSWSIVVKAALAGLFLSAAGTILSVSLLMAGVPLRVVQVLIISAGVVAAAVVAGAAARRVASAGTDLIRARGHGVVAVATAGLFTGLIATLDAGVALGVGAGAAVVGWVGARFATDSGRGWRPQNPDDHR